MEKVLKAAEIPGGDKRQANDVSAVCGGGRWGLT